MFCPECGTKNHENSVFCENCGTRIIEKVQPEVHNPKQQKMPDPPMAPQERERETTQSKVPQQNQMEPMTAQRAVPKARKIPMSTARKIIIAEFILILIVSFGFYKIGTENTSPEKVAIEFASNINERDWNPLYDSLMLSKDKFISKEMLIKGISAGEPVSARNYMISDAEFSHGGNNAQIWVDFMVESGEIRTIQVNLVKEEEKEYLIFDKWKVIPDFLVYDFEIQVPSGAKVSLGGTELDEVYQYDQNENNTWYNIPALFSGEYEIKVNMEPMDDYINYIHSQDGYFSLQNMNLSEDDQVLLMENAADVFHETFAAAFEGKNFSEIKHLFADEKSNTTLVNTVLKQEYDELVDRYELNNSEIMKKLEVYYLNTETEYFLTDGQISVVVYIDFEGEYEENVNGRNYYGTAYGTSSYNYAYSDKKWSITEQNLDFNIY